jgi:hypothetical protein
MKLEGSLDTFSLPDILQLLAFTKKTGALRLTAKSAGTTGVVHVSDGVVSAAASDVSRQSLARRVVGAALVGDEALAAAVDRARQEGVGVVRALLDAGALTDDAVLPVARQQVIDAVCDLLRWPEGEFAFFVDQLDSDNLPVSVSVEDLVAEGQRRLAAWPALTALIPSPATTLSLSVAPSSDPTCSREEWALLALVDGRRTVSAIVSLLGAGEYAVVRALAALVERGLLVTSDGGAAGTGGLADLERRQGLLAGLEGGTTLPAPRPALTDSTELSAAVAALATDAPAGPDAAPAEITEITEITEIAENTEVTEVTATAEETVAETTAQGPTSPVAEAAQPVPESVSQPAGEPASEPVAAPIEAAVADQPRAETTTTVTASAQPPARAAGPDTTVPVTMGSAALDPAAAPAANPAPTPGGEDDPAVTRSVLLRLIAGVQGL